jgi:hypothetical protein
MDIEYRDGPSAFTSDEFLALAQRIWPRDYDAVRAAAALERTFNVGAWRNGRLVPADTG